MSNVCPWIEDVAKRFRQMIDSSYGNMIIVCKLFALPIRAIECILLYNHASHFFQ